MGRPGSARPGQLSDLQLYSTFSHELGQVYSTSHVDMIPLPVHSFREPENKGLWPQQTWRTACLVCTSLHNAFPCLCPVASLSSIRVHNIQAEAPCPPYLWGFLCELAYLCPQVLSPYSRKRQTRCTSLQDPKETTASLGLTQYHEEGAHASTASLPVQGVGPEAIKVRWNP